jgi:hypothetical protein
MRRAEILAGDGEACRCVGVDQHRLAAERGEDMPVRRIARIGDRHPVAGLEHRKKRQNESRRRPRRHDHALRVHIEPVDIRIVPRDPCPQRGNAKRFGIAQRPGTERRPRRLDRRLRRAGRGLADLHVNDTPARRLDPGGRHHHVHHHEGRHVASG